MCGGGSGGGDGVGDAIDSRYSFQIISGSVLNNIREYSQLFVRFVKLRFFLRKFHCFIFNYDFHQNLSV